MSVVRILDFYINPEAVVYVTRVEGRGTCIYTKGGPTIGVEMPPSEVVRLLGLTQEGDEECRES